MYVCVVCVMCRFGLVVCAVCRHNPLGDGVVQMFPIPPSKSYAPFDGRSCVIWCWVYSQTRSHTIEPNDIYIYIYISYMYIYIHTRYAITSCRRWHHRDYRNHSALGWWHMMVCDRLLSFNRISPYILAFMTTTDDKWSYASTPLEFIFWGRLSLSP